MPVFRSPTRLSDEMDFEQALTMREMQELRVSEEVSQLVEMR